MKKLTNDRIVILEKDGEQTRMVFKQDTPTQLATVKELLPLLIEIKGVKVVYDSETDQAE